jgi:CHASE2 domain-containing sensor protein
VPLGPSYTLHSTRYFVTSVVSYSALLVAGVVGGVALWRAGQWPAALGLLLGSALLVCVVFFPQERFRIPVIDPALIVLAVGVRRN